MWYQRTDVENMLPIEFEGVHYQAALMFIESQHQERIGIIEVNGEYVPVELDRPFGSDKLVGIKAYNVPPMVASALKDLNSKLKNGFINNRRSKAYENARERSKRGQRS